MKHKEHAVVTPSSFCIVVLVIACGLVMSILQLSLKGCSLMLSKGSGCVCIDSYYFYVFTNRCVSVEGVHIIEDKYCAFVEFSSPEDTAIALEQMQVCY